MKKKTKEVAVPTVLNNEFMKEVNFMLNNNMADVLGIGTGGEIGADFFSQISQLDTLFKSQRWGLLSNQRQLISQMYVEHGLVQTVIDVPVDDAFRGGLEITTKQLSEEQITQLLTQLESEGDVEEYGQGHKWKRLYGGGAVMVITDQDPSTPLSTKELTEDSFVEFKAIDMWELNNPNFHQDDRAVQHQDGNGEDVTPDLSPEHPEDSVPVERLKLSTTNSCYDYYGEKVHKSRIRILRGMTAPSFIRPRLRGWGLSELERLVRSINQFLKSTDLTFEVLDEFKLDIFKIKNLKDYMMSSKGKQAISDRVAMANQQKNYQNALTMDSEDDYDHKQLSFTGLAEVMTGIRMQVACDMRMPLTKIFGISAAGFSSGEDDIENYNSVVESSIRSKSKSDLLWMVKIRCKQLFGLIPSDLSISFKPLRVLGAVDEESVKDKKFTRLLQTQQAGLCSVKEFKDGVNKGELLPIKLDTSVDLLDQSGNEFDDESEREREDRKDEEGHARAEESAAKAAEREAQNPKPNNLNNSTFKESEHPRAEDGRFGNKSGSSKKSEASKQREKGSVVSEASEAAIKKVEEQGFSFDVDTTDHDGDVGIAVKDKSGKVIASAVFRPDGNGGASTHPYVQVKVDREARRKGIASGIYAKLEKETGLTLKPAESQTSMGKSIWENPKRPFGAQPSPAREPLPDNVHPITKKVRDVHEVEEAAKQKMLSLQGNDKGTWWTSPEYMTAAEEWKKAVRTRQKYIRDLKKKIAETKQKLSELK